MSELEQRARDILAKLSVVSEGSAGKPGVPLAEYSPNQPPPKRRMHGESAPPAGASIAKRKGPPPRDKSLYHHFAWHFERARFEREMRLYIYLAETAYEQRVNGASPHLTALGEHADRVVGAERDARILDSYEGVDALEVALLESAAAGRCTEAHVRHLRTVNRRDPTTGRHLARWAGWSDEERAERVRVLERAGRSVREIATELGTSKSSVDRYTKGWRRVAA